MSEEIMQPSPVQNETDSYLKDMADGVGAGIVKATEEVVQNVDDLTNGGLTAVANTLNKGFDLGSVGSTDDGEIFYAPKSLELSKLIEQGKEQGLSGEELETFVSRNTEINKLTNGLQTIPGQLALVFAQFAIGLAGASKALGGLNATTKLGKAAKVTGISAVADFAVFDELDERLSNIIEQFPFLQNPITNFLQADPADSYAEAKFKQVLEGLGIGGAVGAFTSGLKAVRGIKQGLKETPELIEEASKQTSELGNPINQQIDALLSFSKNIREAVEARKGTIKLSDSDVEGIEEFTRVNDTISTAYKEADSLTGSARTETRRGGRVDAINQMSTKNRASLRKYGDVSHISHEKTFSNAQEYMSNYLAGFMDDTETGLKHWMDKHGGDAKAARETMGRAILVVDTAKENFKKKAALFKAGEISREEVAEAFANVGQAVHIIQAGSSEIGRALELTKVVNGWEAKTLDLAIETGEALAGSGKVEDRYYSNLAKFGGYIKKAGSKGVELLNELYINSILSSFPTHLINVGSTAVNSALLPFEKVLGAGLRLNKKEATKALHMYQGLSMYSWEATKGAWRALKKGQTILDASNSIMEEGTRGKAFPTIGGAFIRAPSTALAAEDEFFKQLNFRAYAFSEAMMDGKQLKLDGEELQKYVRNRVTSAANTQLEASALGKTASSGPAKRAIDHGRVTTFTQPIEKMEPSTIPGLDIPQQLGYTVNQWVQKHPILRQINPFVRTPLNLLSHTAQRNPLSPITSQRWRNDYAAGGQRRAEALARWGIGTGLAFYFYNLAKEGKTTGTGTGLTLDQKKGLKAATGREDNSILINGEYHNISRFSPFLDLMPIMASIDELNRYGAEKEADDIAVAVAFILSDFTRDKSFNSGVDQFMTAVEGVSADGLGPSTEKYLGNRLAALMPYSAFIRRLNNDPYLRQLREVAEGFKKNIPGLSKDLDPIRDIFGNATEAHEYYGLKIFSPFSKSIQKNDSIAKAWQEAADAGVPYSISTPDKTREGLDLTDRKWVSKMDGSPVNKTKPTQTVYDRWLQLSGDISVGGLNLEQQLTKLVDDPRFKQEGTFNYYVGKDRLFEGSKAALLKKTFEFYRKAAWSVIVGRNPFEGGSESGRFEKGVLVNVVGAEYPKLAVAYWMTRKFNSNAMKTEDAARWREQNKKKIDQIFEGTLGE